MKQLFQAHETVAIQQIATHTWLVRLDIQVVILALTAVAKWGVFPLFPIYTQYPKKGLHQTSAAPSFLWG